MLVVKVAIPPLTVPVPRMVVPLLNVTISPFGMLPVEAVIVAVKVTACPTDEGFELEDTAVVVVFFTTCETAPELGANAVSPA